MKGWYVPTGSPLKFSCWGARLSQALPAQTPRVTSAEEQSPPRSAVLILTGLSVSAAHSAARCKHSFSLLPTAPSLAPALHSCSI